MSDALQLPAEPRERVGKGASRTLRGEGRVPAVIYGGKQDATPIHVEEKLLVKQLMTGHFMNSIVMVEVDGKKVRTIPKDVAFHPVNDRPVHADFLRLTKGSKIEVAIPVVFVNEEESPGLKKGGVLNVVRHELDLICEVDKIPSEIEIDVTGMEVGDSIHISEITLPEGAQSAITDRDYTIAGLVAPSALRKSEEEGAEGNEEEGQTGEGMEPGETAATEQGPDDDAAQEQEDKGS
ncbi:MAG: 50S ribosomal protein L25/general stress protein Ctc [Pontixanthobacter sp.]